MQNENEHPPSSRKKKAKNGEYNKYDFQIQPII